MARVSRLQPYEDAIRGALRAGASYTTLARRYGVSETAMWSFCVRRGMVSDWHRGAYDPGRCVGCALDGADEAACTARGCRHADNLAVIWARMDLGTLLECLAKA